MGDRSLYCSVYGVDTLTKEDKEFIAWIKSQPCYFGGKFLEHPKYPYFCEQDWNQESGEFASDPSHIMKRGSTRRDEHQGNLFPNCRRHHMWFEQLTPLERSKFKDVGLKYLEDYVQNRKE